MSPQHELLKVFERIFAERRGHYEGEGLPRRWVDLIHYLDEQERKSFGPPTIQRA